MASGRADDLVELFFKGRQPVFDVTDLLA